MLWGLKQPALFTPRPSQSLDKAFPPHNPRPRGGHRPHAESLSQSFRKKRCPPQGSLYLGKPPPLPTGRRHNGEGATLDLLLIRKAEPQVVDLTISEQIRHGRCLTVERHERSGASRRGRDVLSMVAISSTAFSKALAWQRTRGEIQNMSFHL